MALVREVCETLAAAIEAVVPSEDQLQGESLTALSPIGSLDLRSSALGLAHLSYALMPISKGRGERQPSSGGYCPIRVDVVIGFRIRGATDLGGRREDLLDGWDLVEAIEDSILADVDIRLRSETTWDGPLDEADTLHGFTIYVEADTVGSGG